MSDSRGESFLYTGRVMHSRLGEKEHTFEYPVYGYGFDIDQLESGAVPSPFFSYQKRNLTSLFASDYLALTKQSIREKVKAELRKHNCHDPIDAIFMVTSARYFGYVFNPVTFYYCYAPDGSIRYHIAEINNTFGERHAYVLGGPSAPAMSGKNGIIRYYPKKEFFVSPFFKVEGQYEFTFASREDKTYDVRINVYHGETCVFCSRVWGKFHSLTGWNHLFTIARYPLTAALTMPRILWQAQLLRFKKGIPMLDKPEPVSADTFSTSPPKKSAPSLKERIGVSAARKFLRTIKQGKIDLYLPDGSHERYGSDLAERKVTMTVTSWSAFWKIARDGAIGVGESYVDGDWRTDNLPHLLAIFIEALDFKNETKLQVNKFRRAAEWFAHLMRANTKKNSSKNIRDHYDLSNQFFSLLLDDSMTYSSGIFPQGGESLAEAQIAKLDAIIRKARIRSTDQVLEIGSGWGSFAIRAVQTTGCTVTTTTISPAQKELAEARIKAAGLSDKITVLLTDYRDLEGSFDKVISIEMIEAVGHAFLDTYFGKIQDVLRPNGIAVIQVIAMLDQWYDVYRTRRDWIQKHIFPGSHLPSLEAMSQSVTRSTGLIIENLENFAPHYAVTLRLWREQLMSRWDQIQALGYDDRFYRLFEYYLASCEAEFGTRLLNLYQIVLTRPNNQQLLHEDKSHFKVFPSDPELHYHRH